MPAAAALLTDVLINSEEPAAYAAYDLLRAASRGTAAIDQRWLHALVDEPAKSWPGIEQFAGEDHSGDPVPLDEDLISIFRFLKAPAAIPYLIERIRLSPGSIADELVEALVDIGVPAVDSLIDLYRVVGPEEGGDIAFVLAGMNVHDPRILQILLERLDVSWNDALFHLEVYRDPAAIPALEERAQTATEDQLLDLRDTIEDLREPHEAVAPTPFDIWDLYPEKADPNYDLAGEEERLELLDSAPAKDRAQIAASFFGEEFSVRTHAKLFDLARHDPDASVRGRCWEAFFDQTDDPELRRTMLERLADPETPQPERAGLGVALCRHSDQDAVHRAIVQLASHPETREKGLEAMWRSFNPAFGSLAAAYLDDPNPEARRNAMWAIGYLDVSSHAVRLIEFFENEDLRPDALHNYALVAPGVTTRKRILPLFERIDELAGGLTEGEAEAVKAGLDIRLAREGLDPVFADDAPALDSPEASKAAKVGRNDPCPCGSGKKYKKCCGQ